MAEFSQEFLTTDISHPHHRKAIATLIVAVVIFGIAIAAYSLRPKAVVPDVSPPDFNVLTQNEKVQAIAELKAVVSNSPPLTDLEKTKAIQELKNITANQVQ